MRRKPTARVLKSPHVPPSDTVPLLESIAKKHRSEFTVQERNWYLDLDACSYFTVDGGHGTKRVEKKEKAIAKSLFAAGLGDENGIYPERWHCARVLFSGVTLWQFVQLIDGKNGIMKFSYRHPGPNGGLQLMHEGMTSKTVDLRSLGNGECEAVMHHHERNKLRMLLSSFCGIITDHFWLDLDGFQVEFYDEVWG